MLGISKLDLGWSGCYFLCIQNERTKCSMGTYESTAVTLSTYRRIPLWNHDSSTTFLISGSTNLKLSVGDIFKCRYWKAVSIHKRDRLKKIFYHLHYLWTSCQLFGWSVCFWICPGSWNFYFMYGIHTGIDSFVVHLYHCVTLFGVRFLSGCLHVLNSLINRHNISQLEECGLKDRIGTFAHTDLDRLIDRIDGVKLYVVICDIFL